MIDVSSYQQTIDWTKVRASGVERAYIKLGEDGYGIDPYAIANVHGARAAGVQPGWYWFAHPGKHTAAASVHAFLTLAHGHMVPGDLRPALDLETHELSFDKLDEWKAAWFVPVDAAIGALAAFYSSVWFLDNLTFYADRPIWGAHPDTITDAQRARWSFWQRGVGPVPGIEGLVDLDAPLHPDAVPVIPPPL